MMYEVTHATPNRRPTLPWHVVAVVFSAFIGTVVSAVAAFLLAYQGASGAAPCACIAAICGLTFGHQLWSGVRRT